MVSGAEAATLPRSGILQANSGLTRHTVLQALSQLRAQGWLPNPEQGSGSGHGTAANQRTVVRQRDTAHRPYRQNAQEVHIYST